jgi:ABC transporter substrate binding protein
LASSTTNLTVVQQATSSVPVVFVQVSDPVAQGFVANMTKPGGNLTGFSMYEFSIGGKWLDLLKEPVQQPEKYTLIINLRTVKALGLTVPLPLSGLADELIE